MGRSFAPFGGLGYWALLGVRALLGYLGMGLGGRGSPLYGRGSQTRLPPSNSPTSPVSPLDGPPDSGALTALLRRRSQSLRLQAGPSPTPALLYQKAGSELSTILFLVFRSGGWGAEGPR